MKKIRMMIELEYDNEIMHDDDHDGREWFNNTILLGKGGFLQLHSNEIGDHVGMVESLEILEDGNKFSLLKGGEGYESFIQNRCNRCGWKGSIHYAHNDYQHSNCQEERKNHYQCATHKESRK